MHPYHNEIGLAFGGKARQLPIRLTRLGLILVTDLALALEHPDTRTEAAESIRGLIDAIVLTPAAGALKANVVRRGRRVQAETGGQESGLQIELKGNLAAMLSAAQSATRSPETGDLELQIAMVAGARNCRYRRRCTWSPRESPARPWQSPLVNTEQTTPLAALDYLFEVGRLTAGQTCQTSNRDQPLRTPPRFSAGRWNARAALDQSAALSRAGQHR